MKSRLVYSTEQQIPRKKRPAERTLPAGLSPWQQKLLLRVERKGRGGKVVTVIEGLQLPDAERQAVLKHLKARLGTGGTVTALGFEIQGDHREALLTALLKMGYRPKPSGG